jgi:hypothetical protein
MIDQLILDKSYIALSSCVNDTTNQINKLLNSNHKVIWVNYVFDKYYKSIITYTKVKTETRNFNRR